MVRIVPPWRISSSGCPCIMQAYTPRQCRWAPSTPIRTAPSPAPSRWSASAGRSDPARRLLRPHPFRRVSAQPGDRHQRPQPTPPQAGRGGHPRAGRRTTGALRPHRQGPRSASGAAVAEGRGETYELNRRAPQSRSSTRAASTGSSRATTCEHCGESVAIDDLRITGRESRAPDRSRSPPGRSPTASAEAGRRSSSSTAWG